MAHAGALATLTAEEYPGLTDFFVQVWEGSSDDSKVIFRAYGNSPEEARNRADLGADALNTHEDTGLTPSQLQARVAELEAALRPALEFVELFSNRWDGQHGRHPFGIVTDARKALGVEE